MIKNSLEWDAVRRDLQSKILALPYSQDLRRMLRTVDDLVTELSKIEVDARRTKNNTKVDEKLLVINDCIKTLEQWILLAAFEL
jgi:hypothetical protein